MKTLNSRSSFHYPLRRFRTLLAASAFAISSMTLSVGTFAETDTSRAAAFDVQARKAFAEGEFAQAAQAFAEAYRAAPHASTKYNEAMAWEQAGELARAADAYEQALASAGLDQDRTKAARERLSELEKSLGILSIQTPKGGSASVAHLQNGLIPLRVHLSPGTHDVRIREQDGRIVTRNVDIMAAKVVELLLEVTTTEVKTEPVIVEKPTELREERGRPSDKSSSTWGWVALGGAGLSGAAAGYLGLKTLDALDEYEASGYRDADARDRATSYKLWTNIAWGTAAVAGTVGLVVLLSSGSEQEPEKASTAHIRLAPNGILAGYTF